MAKKSSRVKTAERVSRQKTYADEVYNLRRRLKRRAAAEARKGNDHMAAKLREQAARTYAQKATAGEPRKRLSSVAVEIAAAREGLIKYLRTTQEREATIRESRERTARAIREYNAKGANIPLKDEANAKRMNEKLKKRIAREKERAREREENEEELKIPDELTKAEAAGLFAATADLWAGRPRQGREEIVLGYFGADSLEEAYARMMACQNEERQAEAERISADEEKYRFTFSAAYDYYRR